LDGSPVCVGAGALFPAVVVVEVVVEAAVDEEEEEGTPMQTA
jgi:hypothetical protein